MKFLVGSKLLLSALNTCKGAISQNKVIPVLSCYLFSVDKGKLTVSANNLSRCISKTIEIESDIKCKLAIEAGLLTDILKEFADQPLAFEIEVTGDSYQLFIKSFSGDFSLPAEDGKDFPLITNKTKGTLNIDGEILLSAIDKTLFACGKDASNSALNSLCFEFSENSLSVIGCDAHVLSTVTYDIECGVSKSILIDAVSVSVLAGILPKETISIIIADNSIGFYYDNTSLIFILSDGKYPDWRNVVPLTNDVFLNVHRGFLLSAVKKAKVFVNKEKQLLRFDIDVDKIKVTGEDSDLKRKGVEVIEGHELIGEPLAIGLSGAILTAVASKFDTDLLYAQLSTPNGAVVFRSEHLEIQEAKNLILVMPMMLTA